MTEGKNKKVKFEDAMDRLSEIVKTLENGDASLDDSIALFEEGMKLSASCEKLLKEAEQKVTFLTNENGGKEDE